jgi:uncharacterized phage protein gp47/JayE
MPIRNNYTFSEIFDICRQKMDEFGSNRPTFWGVGSLTRAIFQSISFWVEFLQLQVNIATLAFSISTAKGIHLDRRCLDWGLIRKQPSYAISTQRFTGNVGRVVDITIPAGTIVKTTADVVGNVLEYSLISEVILKITDDFVDRECACTTIGTAGNTGVDTIVNFDVSIPNVLSTTNIEDVTNGSDLETDEQLRERLRDYILGLQTGNEASIKSAVYGVDGVTFVKIVENEPIAGNFAVYFSNDTGIIDAITRAQVEEAIERVKPLCITYMIIPPIIQNINMSFRLQIDTENYEEVGFKSYIKDFIENYINNTRKQEILISDLIYELKRIKGVDNIKEVKIGKVTTNIMALTSLDLILSDGYVGKINTQDDITILDWE